MKTNEPQDSERTKQALIRREWALWLLAGQVGQRANHRKFVRRVAELSPDTGLTERQRRDQARHDLRALEEAGFVRFVMGRKQIRAVVLDRRALRRWWWGDAVRSLARSVRHNPTCTVRKLARVLGVAESTIWRWLSGETAPRAFDLEMLRRFRAFELSQRPMIDRIVETAGTDSGVWDWAGQIKHTERLMTERGMNETERQRAIRYLDETLWRPFFLASESWPTEKGETK